ncbi:MAG: bifunctional (p)ppGpp synthetase/guanosine-3',5'-bis(diphosphate) 3'-pyrophosphohydrolase [Verrucomicrobiales bacterium]|nr:bifunctional (p)ppGpp synthetase/guanosine-3',5'-bis(diphosphate) 3'-pyrophosphohydrolase [Verrucomicrobiales bacterium]
MNTDIASLLAAIQLAASLHSTQRRKNAAATPYINHPIAVAEILARVGGVSELAVLQAAILHDTLEDTTVTREELSHRFGESVCRLVEEVTDDRTLSQVDRKRRQIEHAPHLSRPAQCIKVADKICNVSDLSSDEPPSWSLARKREYVDWAEQVVHACQGCSPALEQEFRQVVEKIRKELRH